MIIIEISGGLGNQMFQYALYLKYKYLGKVALIDNQIISNKLNDIDASTVFEVFSLKGDYCPKKLRNKMADIDMGLLPRIRRKLFGKHDKDTCYYEKKFINNYHPEILDFDNKYLSGFWQCEKYFDDIRKLILDSYTFDIDEIVDSDIYKQIIKSNSVSIHIRRGDYLGNSGYDNVCTEYYYQCAIDYIKAHTVNPKFFIFSDDKEYIKEKYKGDEFIIVDSYKGSKSHYDMYLMTVCKHNIVANSSFSWWGAWLNQNDNKIVIAPEKWASDASHNYTPCEGWIRI